jgi:hypothetical protein
MSTKLVELDRRYFDAWHNQDADAIVAAFALSEFRPVPRIGEVSGRAC